MSHPATARDLRLALPAVSCWLATGLVYPLPAGTAAACGVVIGATAAVATAWALTGRDPRARRELLVVALCCVVAATGVLLVAARTATLENHPVAEQVGRSVTVEAVVTGFAAPTSGEGYVVSVRVERIGSGSEARAARLSTIVFARDAEWTTLPSGTRVATSVRVQEPRSPGDPPALAALSAPRVADGGARAMGVPWALALAVRTEFREVSARALGEQGAALLPSLVLGDELGLPEEVRDEFQVTGLSHLQAVSGANTTFVIGAIVLLAALCGAGRRGRLVVGGVGLAAFVAVVGPDPAVLRAAGTGVIGLLALGARRSGRPLAALSAVVLLVTLLDPQMARGVGFVLSVSATAALIVAARPLSLRMQARGLPGPAADTVAVCLLAQLVTAPLLLGFGLEVSPWSLLLNVLAAPVVPFLTAVGTASAALSVAAPPVAQALAWSCGPALWWLGLLARVGARLPGAPEMGQ